MRKYINHGMQLAFSKTARNTYTIFASNIVSMAAAFFFIIILVRLLSKEDFGYFSALFNILLLVTDLADFGVGSSLSRFLPALASDKKKQLSFLKTAFVTQATLSVVIAIVLMLLSPWLSMRIFKTDSFYPLISVIGIAIFGSIMTNFLLFTLLAKERFGLGSIYSSVIGFGRLIAIVLLYLVGQLYLSSVIWGVALSFLVLSVIGLRMTGIEFLRYPLDKNNLRKLFSYSSFLAIARGFTSIAGKIDVLMITAFLGPIPAGTYAIASRVASLYALFSGSVSTVIAPRIAATQHKAALFQMMKMTILGTGGLIATILIPFFFARFFLVLLFGVDDGAPAVETFRVLLIGMVFFVASIPAVSLALYHLHKPFILTVNSVLQLGIVLVFHYLFIPRYGAVGAAYSLSLAYMASLILTSVMTWYYWKKKYG